MRKKTFLCLLMMLFWSFNLGAKPISSTNSNRDGYKIYPIPQSQVVKHSKKLYLRPTVAIIADKEVDEVTLKRAKDILSAVGLKTIISSKPSYKYSNLYLAVKGGDRRAERYCYKLDKSVLKKKGKFDRHILQITGKNSADIRILGEHCNATFFALASLEQILEQGTKEIKQVLINDYADQQSRGLVEGYYGYPYSIAVKKDLMHFMMRMKMNTYMYGAKSDPYHSEKWEAPYPKSLRQEDIKNGLVSEAMLQDLTKTSHDTKVNFIWAIHPGNDFVSSDDVVERIMHKFTKMYDLGVRQFAVFVDDVGVPQTEKDCQTNADRLTELQKAIDTKWNTGARQASDKVRPLHFVPQVYTLSWVKPKDRKRFYKALSTIPKDITVYFTGRGVWTVPNEADLDTINNDFGRKLAWWWNYPCNDNADAQIFPSDMYQNFQEMPAVNGKSRLPKALANGLGIVSNPMQQGEVSKTALFSVADYAWNNTSFDNKESWERSFDYTLSSKDKREAYKTVLPYLRASEPKEMQTAIEAFKEGNTKDFVQLAEHLLTSIDVVKQFERSEIESERLLYQDIQPWLNKLEAMLTIGKNFARPMKTKAELWEFYAQNIDKIESLKEDKAFTVDALEGLGSHISVSHQQAKASSKYLAPFMAYLKNNFLGEDFFAKSKDVVRLIKSDKSIQAKLVFKNGELYLDAPEMIIPPKGYVQISFNTPVKIEGMKLDRKWLRKNKVYYAREWAKRPKRLKRELKSGTIIRAIYLENTSNKPKQVPCSKEKLCLLLPKQAKCSAVKTPIEQIGASSDKKLGKACIIDGNPKTFSACNRNQKDGDTYEVTLDEATKLQDVRVYFGLVNDDYILKARVEASLDGKQWTNLMLKDTELTEAGVKEARKLNDEVAYLDFVGNVEGAKFVRLVLSKAKTNKWLRLYEISVNHSALNSAFLPKAISQGKQVLELNDGKPFTSAKDIKGEVRLFYSSLSTSPIKTLVVLWNKALWKGKALPKLYYSSDAPKTKEKKKEWYSLGTLDKAYKLIDMSMLSIRELKISWDGEESPIIYEVLEQY